MSFAENLRVMLDMRNMELKELSAGTGISKSTLDNYLSGQKSLPNAENAVKIAQALGVTVEFLVTGGVSPAQYGESVLPKYKALFTAIAALDDIDVASVTALVASMQKRYAP